MKHVYKVEFEGWEIDKDSEYGGVTVREEVFVVAENAKLAIVNGERAVKKFAKRRKFDWLEPSQVIRRDTLSE